MSQLGEALEKTNISISFKQVLKRVYTNTKHNVNIRKKISKHLDAVSAPPLFNYIPRAEELQTKTIGRQLRDEHLYTEISRRSDSDGPGRRSGVHGKETYRRIQKLGTGGK